MQQALQMSFRSLSVPRGEGGIKSLWRRKETNLPTNVSGYVCDNDGVSRLDMRGQVPSHAEIRFVRVGTLHIEKIKIE